MKGALPRGAEMLGLWGGMLLATAGDALGGEEQAG